MAKTFAGAIGTTRRNNFDFIRFLAAGFVIVSHSFALSGGFAEPHIGSTKLGTLGVYIFFTISGYLITQSWDHHPRVSAFIGKRLMRIVPGLVGATLFVALVLGPLFTKVSLRQYFTDPLTTAYFGNISIFSLSYGLPGVWQNNVFPVSTNGPLWTLPLEFMAYLGVAAAGFIGILKNRLRFIPSILAVLGVTALLIFIFKDKPHQFLDVNIYFFIANAAFFAMGSLYYTHRSHVVYSDKLALLALAIFIVSPLIHGQYLLRLLVLPYIVLYLAFIPTKHIWNFAKYGDVSYGMYIYAWPVQQSIYALNNGPLNPLKMTVLAFPAVVGLSYLSWHFIEKHFIKRKHHFGVERYPVDARTAY